MKTITVENAGLAYKIEVPNHYKWFTCHPVRNGPKGGGVIRVSNGAFLICDGDNSMYVHIWMSHKQALLHAPEATGVK